MKRTQTILAVLSVALGVAAFTSVMSVREWQRQQIEALADRFAPNVLVVRFTGQPVSGEELLSGQVVGGILFEEAMALGDLPGVVDVAYRGGGSTSIDGNIRITRVPVSEHIFDVLGLELGAGHGLTEDDRTLDLPVAVLGATVATELFGGADQAVGKAVELGHGMVARVEGVLAPIPEGVAEFASLNVAALVPTASAFSLGLGDERPVGSYAFVQYDPRQAAVALQGVRRAVSELPVGQVHEVVDSREWLGTQYRFRNEVADALTRGSTWVVVLALLATLANLANALGLRAADRARPLAVRRALGATRARIALEVVGDGLRVGGLGTLLGIAVWPLVSRLLPIGAEGVPVTPAALLLGLGAGVVVTGLSAAVPAAWTLRLPIYRALREELAPPVWEGVALTGMAAGVLALMVASSIGVGAESWFQRRLQEVGGDRLVLSNQQPPGSRASVYPPPPLDERDAEAVAGVSGVAELVVAITENTALVLDGPAGQVREPIAGARVDAGFFEVFPRPVLHGRVPASPSEVIIGPWIAERAFPGMPLEEVVGRTLRLGTSARLGADADAIQEVDVVGVYASQPFVSMGDLTDSMIVRLMPTEPAPWAGALVRDFHVRIDPEADRDAVIDAITGVIDRRYADDYAPARVYEPAGDLRDVRATMTDVAGAWNTIAWLSLLVGAAGLASIVTVRLVKARPELALRRALGATAAKIAAASTGAALRISTYATALGLVLAVITIYWVSTLAPWEFVLPFGRVVLVVIVATVVALAAVTVPVAKFSRTPPWSVLKEE